MSANNVRGGIRQTERDLVLGDGSANQRTLSAPTGASGTVTLPATTGTDELTQNAAAQTLTNKTIDGDDNTVQDLALSSLKTVLGEAGNFLTRDSNGDVEAATKAAPTGAVVGTSDAQTLTNKTIDADLNTITNIEDADIAAGAAINATKLADGSVDNTEFQKLGTAGTDAAGELVTTDGTQDISGKTVTDDQQFTSTGAIKIPVGTNAQRPGSPVAGQLRFNSDGTELEVYNGSSWATPSSGVVSTGTIDTQTKSADGAVISAGSIFMQTADATHPGLASTGAQTFAGEKTFNDNVSVGASSPASRLHVSNGDSSSPIDGNTVALFDNSGNTVVQIGSGTGSLGTLAFSNSEGVFRGEIRCDHSLDRMSFRTGGTVRLNISGNGQLTAEADGAASAPAWSFANDPDTGIYRPDSGEVGITSNGSRCVRMRSDYQAWWSSQASEAGEPYRFLKSATSTVNNDFMAFFRSSANITTGTFDGSIRTDGSGNLVIDNTSDQSLKTNIVDLQGAWDKIKALKPRKFDWTSEDAPNEVNGFIAQEFETVFPDSVREREGIKTVSLGPSVIANVIAALREALERIEVLEAASGQVE